MTNHQIIIVRSFIQNWSGNLVLMVLFVFFYPYWCTYVIYHELRYYCWLQSHLDNLSLITLINIWDSTDLWLNETVVTCANVLQPPLFYANISKQSWRIFIEFYEDENIIRSRYIILLQNTFQVTHIIILQRSMKSSKVTGILFFLNFTGFSAKYFKKRNRDE